MGAEERFAEFARLCQRLGRATGRLEKRRSVAQYLRSLPRAAVANAVAFLTGRPFAVSDPRILGVRGLPPPAADASGLPLTLTDVAAAFAEVAGASGPGVRRAREARLTALASRADAGERQVLARIIAGEMRTGVSDGLVLEAIAEAVGADPGVVRRAALFMGDLAAVADLALGEGVAALAAARPRLFVPWLPMLSEIAGDFDDVLAAHGGRTALEYKYDGARIQLHGDGERIGIWSRRLSDVTASLPDVVVLARRDLRGAPFVLDGEVVARDPAGRPLPFQKLMRRFRRVHGVEALVEEVPLALHFFDCLVLQGRPLIDVPYAERWRALEQVTGGRYLAERAIVTSAAAAQTFRRQALDAGHEGVMAKDLGSPYEPGGRGELRQLYERQFETKGRRGAAGQV